jgi:hypothetical protein
MQHMHYLHGYSFAAHAVLQATPGKHSTDSIPTNLDIVHRAWATYRRAPSPLNFQDVAPAVLFFGSRDRCELLLQLANNVV